jgi:cytidylate kinase
LKESGEDARIAAVLADLHERDRRDSEREAAPLAQAPDARVLDNSKLDLEAAADLVCSWLGES